MRKPRVLVSLATLLLAACATAPVKTAASVPASTPPPARAVGAVPADDVLNATLWTQRAVEHDLVFEEVYRAAEAKLPVALADPTWDALPPDERTASSVALPPAVIVDVDETVLDNSPYETQLIRTGEEFNESTWSQWCRKEAARPLPGALEFARFASAHGVKVFYVTNRGADLDPATVANLRKVGFPVPADDVVLGLGTVVPGCTPIGSEKGCRRRLIGREYRVLMMFGDQLGDFVDVHARTPGGRERAIAPYASWIGERWWVLPNPIYGSWESACFDNDWKLSRERRRAAKIKCLRGE